MTKDVLVVTSGTGWYSLDSFTKEVFNTIKKLENKGYDVEVKYSTSEGRHDKTVHSAMIIAYDAE